MARYSNAACGTLPLSKCERLSVASSQCDFGTLGKIGAGRVPKPLTYLQRDWSVSSDSVVCR
jgi:hypothetical protein